MVGSTPTGVHIAYLIGTFIDSLFLQSITDSLVILNKSN